LTVVKCALNQFEVNERTASHMNSLDVVLSCLGDSTRFRILRLLLERDLCVGALARELKISEPAVSQHLKKLREGGLVAGEKRGYWMHYVVNTMPLIEAAEDLKALASTQRSGDDECSRKNSAGGCCCATKKRLILPDFRM
jgi:ArsR family transcriptional regulator, arsenate/arsenite/antimonite-responsive transcriptional repressor